MIQRYKLYLGDYELVPSVRVTGRIHQDGEWYPKLNNSYRSWAVPGCGVMTLKKLTKFANRQGLELRSYGWDHEEFMKKDRGKRL